MRSTALHVTKCVLTRGAIAFRMIFPPEFCSTSHEERNGVTTNDSGQGPTNRAIDAEWGINDAVTRLRLHGHVEALNLSALFEAQILGSTHDCSWQLSDPTGCISRHHAELVRRGVTWMIRDLGSTNGIYRDRDRLLSFEIRPGDEIEIGGLVLVAESRQSIALHSYLARLIGWSDELRSRVDRALRAVRDMARLRSALMIAGAAGPDLESIARRVHELTLGSERPFRAVQGAALRSNLGAHRQTIGGTLCVTLSEVPDDFASFAERLGAIDSRARLVICCPQRPRTDPRLTTTRVLGDASARLRVDLLELPLLETRDADIARLITEYAHDAASKHGYASAALREHEETWLHRQRFKAFVAIEDFAERLVHLRNLRVTRGAQRIGIQHSALSRWASRHGIPT